jgi:hypothetical protein
MFRMAEEVPEREPSAAELVAIEAEWPRIEAGLAAVDDQIRRLVAGPGVDELSTRRARRVGRRVLRPTRAARRGGDAA